MNTFRPDAVTSIGGRRCVILRDAVAHALPPSDELVVLDRCDGRMIYCASSVLKDARKRHPRLPAYGFWQVLFHSGLVNRSERLQAVRFDGGNGQYLYQEDAKVAFSGEIRGGDLIAGAGYVPAAAAVAIDCDVQRLRLPRNMALSFEERERALTVRKFRWASGFAAFIIFLGAAVLAYENRQRVHGAEAEITRAALAVRVEALVARKTALQGTRIETWPDQRRTLDDLLRFAIAFERFTLPETPFGGPEFEARAPDPGVRLPTLVTTIVSNVEHRRDGLLSLRWSNPR